MPELRGALRASPPTMRADRKPTVRPARCAHTIADAVLDVELLALAAVGVQQDCAVGQHAVDVEQDQPDARRSLLDHGAAHG